MMKKIFLGPPGSGKGTYSSRISSFWKIPHISTGDLFRAHLKNQTEIGKQIKEFMNSGNLVPDTITIEMLKNRISQNDCKKGFILDGFPRTIPQAEELAKITDIDVVINLNLSNEILIKKACARRVCQDCGDIYSTIEINQGEIKMPGMFPKEEGKCDKCHGELMQRKDDNEATVKERLETFKNQTAPLIDFYKNNGLLKDIQVKYNPTKMVSEILQAIKSLAEKYELSIDYEK
ncbi:adenylate kinase [archaeon]|nr:adenylate kinase [archaeon]MBT4373837.1 adenylate kinase [archaeon]MBT4532359.1 adenylate kinase [archaeon]MBT7001740.1 adenylate kinase [archaeon]